MVTVRRDVELMGGYLGSKTLMVNTSAIYRALHIHYTNLKFKIGDYLIEERWLKTMSLEYPWSGSGGYWIYCTTYLASSSGKSLASGTSREIYKSQVDH